MKPQPPNPRIAVIMAGGSGERFWPLSRENRPKQLLALTHPHKSMLAEAVERVAPIVPAADIYVATGRRLVEPIRAAGVGVPGENVITEPCKRNTAGCLAYVAATLLAKHGDAAHGLTMAVTTADHRIGDDDLFRECIRVALEAAEHEDALVIVGVAPTRAETGFGYIQVADPVAPAPNAHPRFPVFPVAAFKEKPGIDQAEEFLRSGRYLWNSGMFFWRVSVFLAELAQCSPAHARAVETMAEALRVGDAAAADACFETLPSEPIDIALMERAQRVLVVKGDFPWDDVGAWPTLDRSMPADANGNVAVGDPVLIDCRDSIVYNQPGADAVSLCAVGVEGLVVVVTPDAVLVMPKDKAQDVRKAIDEMKRRGSAQV